MTPAIIWLGWACYAGAAAAIVIYLRHLLGPEGWKRPWGAAGLLFTSLALGQTPFLFEDAYDRARISRAFVVSLCLLIAVALQAFALLRSRNAPGSAPDSAHERAADASGTPPAETPSQGPAA